MPEPLKKILQEKDVIDALLDVFEKGSEMVASVAGDIFPVSSVAALVRLMLDNVESKEAQNTNEQFQKVRDRLSVITNQTHQIKLENIKNEMNIKYFKEEQNLRDQYRTFMDIFDGNTQIDLRKKMFLDGFWKTGGDQNLHTLYNAVTGDNFCGTSVLDIILECEQKSRGAVEKFCTKLKQLFCIGLIALLGYAALEGQDEEKSLQDLEEKMKVVLQNWEEKMKVVQSKINVAIEDCINSFPTQAESDTKLIVAECSDKSNQELADLLMDHFKMKYDWVSWSVRVFNSPTGLFTPKKDYQGLMGKKCFQVPASDEKSNVVISYSTSPKPIDKALILTLMMVLKHNRYIFKKPSMTLMARQLFMTFPFCVVHTIKSSSKDLGFSYSFSDELHCSVKFKDFYVFLHSA